jgi:hypothetical protein
MANGEASPARRLWNWLGDWSAALEGSPYDDVSYRLSALERDVAQLKERQVQPQPAPD